MECPTCHQSDDIHSSRRRIFDYLLVICLVSPYRCWSCSTRFHRCNPGALIKGPGVFVRWLRNFFHRDNGSSTSPRTPSRNA